MGVSANGNGLRLRSADFRREREEHWQELEELVNRAEKSGLRSLTTDELHRLPGLYRDAVSSLSVARAISLDRNVLAYLESLVARAYFCIYGVKPRARRIVRRFFSAMFPQAVRLHARAMLVSIALMLVGIVLGLSIDDPDLYDAVVPAEMAQERSHQASTEDLRKALYSEEDHTDSELGVFTAFLFTNNAKVGMLAFALGFALGLPTVILMLYNGLMLGAMAGLYASRGLGLEFWLWVLPHGVTELLAVCLCGGAGLVLAHAVVAPGRHGRLHALAAGGRQAALVVLGCVVMLFAAGVIEGVFRQLVHDVWARGAMAAASLAFWLVYLVLRRTPEELSS